MRKRICILYTGGTIGMRRGEHGYVPEAGLGALLPALLPSLVEDEIPDYEVVEYAELIDSAEAVPTDWQRIGGDIQDRYADFDGFVVLHGTDTMAYTASALSFLLDGLRKPVIVTGSQIPLREKRNDARNNLLTALLLAAHYPVPEVCLYFNGRLLRGNRATKVQADGFDAFDSPNAPWLGRVGIRIQIEREQLRPPAAAEAFAVADYNGVRVNLLQIYPGLPASVVTALCAEPADGLVLRCYGVGNAPVRQPGVLAALAAASARGLVITCVSQCLQGRVAPGQYAPGAALAEAGVVSGGDMTTEAAFTKLIHLLATQATPDRVRAAMLCDLRGELTSTP